MINASDLYTDVGWKNALNSLFPTKAKNTPLKLVRIACHFDELEKTFSIFPGIILGVSDKFFINYFKICFQ